MIDTAARPLGYSDATLVRPPSDRSTELSIFVAGDSTATHDLVLDLFDHPVSSYAVKSTLANRELIHQLFSGRHRPTRAEAAALFPPRPPGRNVPFLPGDRLLSPPEKEAAIQGFREVVAGGQFTSGPHVAQFEGALADFLGVEHVVATASGTDALIVALTALGVRPGDEVVMPANSYAATENAVFMVGATPVLVDVDPATATMDPSQIAAATTSRTRAVLVVHLHGKLADMRSTADVARAHGLFLIEDACQAIGVTGVARFSDAAALSFNPAKTLGLCGKAGALLTNHGELARRYRMIAYHGFEPGQKNVKAAPYGANCLIDNTSASIGLRLLPYLGLNNFKRAFLAKRYELGLREHLATGRIRALPFTRDNGFALYPVFLRDEADRDTFRDRLSRSRVATELNYPMLTNRQDTPLHRRLFADTHLPHTESVNRRAVCLPLFNGMSLAEQDHVIEAARQALT
jgi:3-dehydro-glucose-6-phosphate--glutamate transaminase